VKVDLSKVTRVTVVSDNKREYEGWDLYKKGARIVVQDNGRTMKVLPGVENEAS